MEKHYDVRLTTDNKFEIYDRNTSRAICICETLDTTTQIVRALELAYAVKIVFQVGN